MRYQPQTLSGLPKPSALQQAGRRDGLVEHRMASHGAAENRLVGTPSFSQRRQLEQWVGPGPLGKGNRCMDAASADTRRRPRTLLLLGQLAAGEDGHGGNRQRRSVDHDRSMDDGYTAQMGIACRAHHGRNSKEQSVGYPTVCRGSATIAVP